MSITAYNVAYECMMTIKQQMWFPFRTGNLKYSGLNIMQGTDTNKATIYFDGDRVPYLDYLEYGTKPHNIPNAFGFGEDFGTYGRYDLERNRHAFMSEDLFFHSGSKKHKGFISSKSVNACVKYICWKYKGQVE